MKMQEAAALEQQHGLVTFDPPVTGFGSELMGQAAHAADFEMQV
jgi:hypothetical protein